MKAIIYKSNDINEDLQFIDISIPQPNDNDLLIKIHSIGVNRADLLQRTGKYLPPKGESPILGLEVAGEIICCGKEVKGLFPGQRVCGLVSGGAYAEFCLLDYRLALPIPEYWSYSFAAAIPETFTTAHQCLFALGQLKPNETILIQAGASGIGTIAIQMAYYIGATVYTTVGATEKIEPLKQLGATQVINYKNCNWEQELLKKPDNFGVDIILDLIGAKYFSDHIKLLKPGGRMIHLGLLGGIQAQINLLEIINKFLTIKGFILRTQSIETKAKFVQQMYQQWFPILLAGKIKPVIDKIFSFQQVNEAHTYIMQRQNIGKIILRIDE